jgi:hypothetical protein
MKNDVMIAGAWFKDHEGATRQRVVLRCEKNKDGFPTKFIVHDQFERSNGTFFYESGIYFDVFDQTATGCMEQFTKASQSFEKRVKDRMAGVHFNSLFGW